MCRLHMHSSKEQNVCVHYTYIREKILQNVIYIHVRCMWTEKNRKRWRKKELFYDQQRRRSTSVLHIQRTCMSMTFVNRKEQKLICVSVGRCMGKETLYGTVVIWYILALQSTSSYVHILCMVYAMLAYQYVYVGGTPYVYIFICIYLYVYTIQRPTETQSTRKKKKEITHFKTWFYAHIHIHTCTLYVNSDYMHREQRQHIFHRLIYCTESYISQAHIFLHPVCVSLLMYACLFWCKYVSFHVSFHV